MEEVREWVTIKASNILNIKGKAYSLLHSETFIENKCIDKIILVLPEDEIDYCKKEVLDKYGLKVDRYSNWRKRKTRFCI